jgi:hypothetical protein
MKGVADIPELRLEVLTDFVTKWMTPPELMLSGLFPESDSPSDTIKWESKEGGRGMAPFVAPGSPAPLTFPYGIAQHEAKAAFWKEKMYFDETFLNNLRKEGSLQEYKSATEILAENLAGLTNRSKRRKEWMIAKMITAGSFSYNVQTGYKSSVDYGVRSTHIVSLTADYCWNTGTSRDILEDITDGKQLIADDCGSKVDVAMCNSTVLKYLANDPTILTLLQKSTFGSGDLFKGNLHKIIGVNAGVVASLLDIGNLVVYDELYEVRANLTAVVTGSSTVEISVDDVSDFEVGGTLRFVDVSAGTYEDETIASISVEGGTVTVSSAPTASFKANEDYVVMYRKYVPDNTFVMMASRVDGRPIAEFKRAPFGNARGYGLKPDRWEEKDPEGVWIRVQDKGLPILKQRDAVYILTVTA